MMINNFKLYTTGGKDLFVPKRGYGITLLVEGSDIGATYFNKMPFTSLPNYAYTPLTQKVYNKVLITKVQELKKNYGAPLQFVFDPAKLKNKTFVFDITPYLAYLKHMMSVMRYIKESKNFLNGAVANLKKSGEPQLLIYYVDPSIIPDGINIRSLYLFNLLLDLRQKVFDFPFDKVFIYMAEKKQLRIIYDRSMGDKNRYGTTAKFVQTALETKHIKMDAPIEDEEEDPKDIKKQEKNIKTSLFGRKDDKADDTLPNDKIMKVKDKVKVDTKIDTIDNKNKKPPITVAQQEPEVDSNKPKIMDKAVLVTAAGATAKNVILPVAKNDPISKASAADQKKISQAEVNDAISDIVKNAKSMMSTYNINTNTLMSRLSAMARANQQAADALVQSYNNQDAAEQISLAKAAVDADDKATVNESSADIQEQEEISHEMGLDKEENIDPVNDKAVVNKLMKNNIALAIARRHNYKEKIVEDVRDEVAPHLAEVGYRVSKVWFSNTSTAGTEIHGSQFDVLNIKCFDSAGKAVTLKFRVPAIIEDRYVMSGGLKWFFPTVVATLPIFIVKKYHAQIRTNYSSISFFYGVFNKQTDVRCFVGGFKIPLTLMMSLLMGISGTLKRYNISFAIMDKKPRDSRRTSFPLVNGKFLVCDTPSGLPLAKKIIIGGLVQMFKKYKFNNIDDTNEIFGCLRAYTKEPRSEYVLRQTIKFIMDVQTVNVLRSNNLPTKLSDVVPYCAALAMSGKTSDKLSIDNVYLRTTDIITTAVGKGVAQGVANFRRMHMYDPNKDIKVDSGFVSKYFRDQGALQLLQQQNPVEEVGNYAEVRIVGPGGLPNGDAVMVRDRAVRNSHFGNIDPSDTSEGDPGVKMYMSLGHMYDEKQHGFMKMQMTNSNNQIMGPAASTTPYVEANDQARTVMSCSQARQAVPIENAELPIVMTGAESIIPAMTSSTFAKKAKEDSVVEYIDDNCMILKGNKSGDKQIIDMRPETLLSGSGKNAAIEQKPIVKVGDKVKKFDIVAKNQFIKPYLTQGTNAVCAYMSYSYNYEDAFVISRSFADSLVSLHNDSIEVTLMPNDKLDIFPKIGDKFNAGDTILRVKKSIVGDMALSEDAEVIAPERCKITDIKVYPNGDINQVATVIKNVNDYYKATNAAIKAAGGNVMFDQNKTLKNAGKYTSHGEPLEGNLLEVSVLSYMPARLGDKLANRHGGKGVIGKILPDDKMPYFMHNGKKVVVDIIYPNLCVIGRQNVGQLHELGSTKVVKAATDKLEKLYNSKAKRADIEDFIVKFYEGMDNTPSKNYSTQLAKNLKSMNDSEFNKYIEETVNSGMRLIAAPFQGDTISQLEATAKKLGVSFCEYLYLPEFGPNVKTMYPVAVGWMYMQKLEQIAKLKSHSRNIGRYVKTTMQPTRGKAQAGGARFSEMDSYCALTYPGGLELIGEMFAVSSDNQDVKKQVIDDIVMNGHADISSEVKLSGSGQYFNNITTAMGISVE